MRWVKRLFKLAIAIYLFLLAISWVFPRDPSRFQPADVIIVHGAGGEDNALMQPSIDRALIAIDAYKAGLAPTIVTTGGRDAPQNRAISEMMRDIIIAGGVPAEAVIVETNSQSTYANLAEARAVLGGYPNRVILVSHGFHLPRVWAIAKLTGAEDVALLSARPYYKPFIPNGVYITTREMLAWPANAMRLAGRWLQGEL